MVSPTDKKTDNKNKISKYGPVSVLHLKNELVSTLSDYMSPFISSYREGYRTQHVLVGLI